MEAARQRVEVLERELHDRLGRAGSAPLAIEVLELRRKLQDALVSLEAEERRRALAEEAATREEAQRAHIAALEESLERVQGELQRRRRVDEALWRKAAQADLRVREAADLRAALKDAQASSAREARRADAAEIELMRTQMRLAIELARPRVSEPWSRDAVSTSHEQLTRTYDPDALLEMGLESLRPACARLAFLIAELIWSDTAADPGRLGELLELLERAGHPLHRHDAVRLGPQPLDAPGLRLAIGPLALQVAVRRRDRREVIVTLSAERALRIQTRSASASSGRQKPR